MHLGEKKTNSICFQKMEQFQYNSYESYPKIFSFVFFSQEPFPKE